MMDATMMEEERKGGDAPVDMEVDTIPAVQHADVATTVVQNFFERDDAPSVTETYKAACTKVLQEVQEHHNWNTYVPLQKEGIVSFLLDDKFLNGEVDRADLDELTKAFVEAVEQDAVRDSKERLAALDYEIVGSKLSHEYDLDQFIGQVRQVAEWHVSGIKTQDAPYFSVIQSSGMGKTKLMYHACQVLAKADDWCCCLVLPEGVKPGSLKKEANKVFRRAIDLKGAIHPRNSVDEAVSAAFDKLDDLLQLTREEKGLNDEEKCITAFLCFDEAQDFLTKFKQHDAFLFRIIRLWLRKKRKNVRVVACFAGTTASLSGFRFEDDDQPWVSKPSREWQRDGQFHDKGSKFFPVFTQTTTIGCIAKTNEGSEYTRAIRYGRPLFAIMDKNGELNSKLPNILGRMLLSETDWEGSPSAWLSILATRVQMGQTTFKIASDLVAKGYAHLTSVSTGTAQVCYMPDPACARLAMCLMDPGFVLGPFKGHTPKWWVDQMVHIFGRGLCSPEKGDVGEVMVAFYLLLSGDSLRKTNDSKSCDTFSVPLLGWIRKLKSGGHSTATSSSPREKRKKSSDEQHVATPTTEPSDTPRKSERIAKKQESVEPPQEITTSADASQQYMVTISFIQVCRNSLRSYGCDWAGFTDQHFLKYLYESATAFYVFAGCPMIDMAASMKITNTRTPGVETFAPLLISIKSHYYFGPADAAIECKRMVDEADRSGCEQALCILIVFGSPTNSNDGKWALDDAAVWEMAAGKVVARVLRIPVDDAFGVTDAFVELTSGGAETGEVAASHPFIRAYGSSSEELDPQYALRATASDEAKAMLCTLAKQLRDTTD